MVTIELNNEERQLLLDVLKGLLADLRMEIADNASSFFSAEFKKREDVLRQIITRLEQ